MAKNCSKAGRATTRLGTGVRVRVREGVTNGFGTCRAEYRDDPRIVPRS